MTSKIRQTLESSMYDEFSERDIALINNCIDYSKNNPAGLPGHNTMMLVAKLHEIAVKYARELDGQRIGWKDAD